MKDDKQLIYVLTLSLILIFGNCLGLVRTNIELKNSKFSTGTFTVDIYIQFFFTTRAKKISSNIRNTHFKKYAPT